MSLTLFSNFTLFYLTKCQHLGYGQRPGTAVDVYRPSPGIYESRPPLYPERPSQSYYPSHPSPYEQPRPQYGNIDRLGNEEPEYYRPGPQNKPEEPIYFGYPAPQPPHPMKPGYPAPAPAPPPRQPYHPYLIGKGQDYGMYGGGFPNAGYYNKGHADYWGLGGGTKRKDGPFNYNSLVGGHGGSAMYGFGGQGNGYSYGGTAPAVMPQSQHTEYPAGPAPAHTAGGASGGYYNGGGSQWSRRPGVDGKSIFNLHIEQFEAKSNISVSHTP